MTRRIMPHKFSIEKKKLNVSPGSSTVLLTRMRSIRSQNRCVLPPDVRRDADRRDYAEFLTLRLRGFVARRVTRIYHSVQCDAIKIPGTKLSLERSS